MSARLKKRNPWIVFSCVTAGILVCTFLSIFFFGENVPTRIGVAIVGDPTVVFSYDPVRKIVMGVSVPGDVSVDMVRGYGVYPISSVWKLDGLDKRRGVVFTETLEEAIGIPIHFFLDAPIVQNPSVSPKDRVLSTLSGISVFKTLFDMKRTNIPIPMLFELMRFLPTINPTEMVFFDLADMSVYADGLQADGTSSKKIDPEKLSYHIGTYAEDAQIRKEDLRVAVYNTTKSPGLAQKVSRVIEKAGFHVVTVANNETFQPTQCVVKAKKDVMDSVTVKSLVWLYRCSKGEENDTTFSEVTLILGTHFEKRFFSY